MFSADNNGNNQGQRMMMQNNLQGWKWITLSVRQDSLVEFPIIGDLNIVGKTIKEAELYLESLLSEFYVDPFIVLGVSTKRIFV